jgi:hypothetical protein
MKKIKLKYDTRVADRMYLAGSEVPVPTLAEVQEHFPSMEYRPHSRMIAVKFPGVRTVTFLAASQAVVCE